MKLRPPLIGRTAELDRLRGLLESASAGDRAGSLIWGEAGVGKSRLLDEFATLARDAGACVGSGACFEYAGAPFAPLAEAFAAIGLPALAFDAETGATPASAHAAKHRFFTGAIRALAERARSTPVVCILDDVQWADFATLEFLSFFARPSVRGKLLVLAAVRSDDVEGDHERLEAIGKLQKDGFSTLALEPLADAEMRRLIANVWPGEALPDAEQMDRICALAEGKPYFAEELVDSLARRGAPAGPSPSIRAGVLARFEQLSRDDRRVLTYASVVGRRFDASLLAQLCGVPQESVFAALARARALQLVRETAFGDAFVFRHAITRAVVYGELLRAHAREIHYEIAQLLSNAPHAGDAAELAHHWASCGDDARAAEAYERAGDDARKRNAYADAARAYGQAAERASAASEPSPELCEKLQRALSVQGDIEASCTWAQRAVDAYVANGRSAEALPLALKLARRQYELGRPERAIDLTDWVVRSLDSHALDPVLAADVRYDAYVSRANFEALQGQTQAALDSIARADAIGGERPPLLRHAFLLTRALVRACDAQLGAGFSDYEEAAALARAIGDDERLIWTLNNYGSRALVTGRLDAAIAALRESHDVARQRNFRKTAALSLYNLALAHLLAGNLADAASVRASGAEGSAALTQTIASAVRLRLATLRADDGEAERCADPEIVETAFRSGETQNIGLIASCFADYYDAVGRSAEAARLRTRAFERIRSVDFSFWLLDRLAGSPDAGERAGARRLLHAAARDFGHRMARAHLALFDARVALRDGGRATAKPLALEAAAAFSTMGLPWERAQALEVAGRAAEAIEIYRRFGYVRDYRRVADIRRRLRHRPNRTDLTDREKEIVRMAIAGKSNRTIARELAIGERTVETHIAAVFDRFELTSRAQLASALAGRVDS